MNGGSNIDDVERWLDEMIDSINFTLPGKDQSIGRDLAGVVAEGIADRSVPDARDPDGASWAPNEEPYKSWKRKKYDADQPGILTGQMLSLESLKGETDVAPDQVTMKYGTGKPAERARNGAARPKAANPATDREKARYFTDSGRPFYALDAEIAAKCVEEAKDAITDYLKGV